MSSEIPAGAEKYVGPSVPKNVKLMAAKGAVPLPPAILAPTLAILATDADPEISATAEKTLVEMPEPLVLGFLKDPKTPPSLLDFFARKKANQPTYTEAILLNRMTSDSTFIHLAPLVSEAQSQIIANNQVRLLRSPAIAEALKKNTNVLRSTLDTMISFLRINGVAVEGESSELTADEIKAILNAPEPTEEKIPETLIEELPKEATEEQKKTLYQIIQDLSVAQKVKLALKGNKEARSLLIKDKNKVVCTGVIKSPKITEGEVLAIAQSRTVNDEVIRIIANNREWTRNYNLQVALSNNPKAPFAIALKFVRTMNVGDLQKMSKNKNVSQQLNKLAKELYEKKRG